MTNKVFNTQKNKAFRQKLRSNMPQPELLLWQRLRAKQLGVKFRRQHGIGVYIVDFYCSEKRLVIELDGDSHYSDKAQQSDIERDQYLHSKGLKVMRFTNDDVNKELDAVVSKILEGIRA